MKTMMYITSGVMGITLALLAQYCAVPWYWRYPAYFVMGVIIATLWEHKQQ